MSILQAGAFFGCFFTTPVASRLGRRTGLIISSLVFTLGTILQVINTHTLGTFYAGRVIAGVGIGAATVLIPMYAAEMSPKEVRGRLGACFQWFFACGVMVAYWVTYAVSKDQPSATKQWQIALGLQLLPSTLLLAGMCTVKESARWLAAQGRTDAAWDSLRWVRGGEETADLRQEFDEILTGLQEEARVRENWTWRELLLPANRYRIFIAVTIQLCAQLTGNTSLAYYATQIFAAVGAGTSAKLVTGFFGVVKVVGVSVFQLLVMDRIGRRVPFMVGAGAMGSFMLIIACVLATHPTKASPGGAETGATTHAGIAMIIMTYAEAFSFNIPLGPTAMAVRGGNLLESHARGGSDGGGGVAVAVQLYDVASDAARDREHWMADVSDVCHFQLFHYRVFMVLFAGGQFSLCPCPRWSLRLITITDIPPFPGRNAKCVWGKASGKEQHRRDRAVSQAGLSLLGSGGFLSGGRCPLNAASRNGIGLYFWLEFIVLNVAHSGVSHASRQATGKD